MTDPTKRINTTEILAHPWLQGLDSEPTTSNMGIYIYIFYIIHILYVIRYNYKCGLCHSN